MISIRKAIPGDEEAIFSLINELALYEKAPEQVSNTAEQLAIDLFSDEICDAIVAVKEILSETKLLPTISSGNIASGTPPSPMLSPISGKERRFPVGSPQTSGLVAPGAS